MNKSVFRCSGAQNGLQSTAAESRVFCVLYLDRCLQPLQLWKAFYLVSFEAFCDESPEKRTLDLWDHTLYFNDTRIDGLKVGGCRTALCQATDE